MHKNLFASTSIICAQLFNMQLLHKVDLHFVALDFNQSQYVDSLFEHFRITKPNGLERWVVKRKSEFLAGRIAASRALKPFGFGDVEIRQSLNRAPVWPESLFGSITHCGGCAAAIACRSEEALAGIDLEQIIEDTLTYPVFLSTSERELISNHPNQKLIATAVFSAKESFYKALFPIVCEFFDFDAVELTGISPNHLTFRVSQLFIKTFKINGIPDVLEIDYRFIKLRSNEPAVFTMAYFSTGRLWKTSPKTNSALAFQ